MKLLLAILLLCSFGSHQKRDKVVITLIHDRTNKVGGSHFLENRWYESSHGCTWYIEYSDTLRTVSPFK